MKSDSEDDGLGYIRIENASVTITAGEDGIQAYREVLIAEDSTSITITSGGGASAATNGYSGTVSAKGIKSSLDVRITGGALNINSRDDAIHAGAAAQVAGGTLVLKTDDDGIHGDLAAIVDAGAITITKSYEGIEAAKITVNGGVIDLTASDDGLNASDGTAETVPGGGGGGRPGQGGFGGGASGGNANCALIINGGTITVNSGGDGLDSNGAFTINGGLITVHGPTASMDGAIDSDGTMLINGGQLQAGGSSGMVQAPATASGQYVLVLKFSASKPAGTRITIKNAAGTVLSEYTAAKTIQALTVSVPEFVPGTYTVYTNDASGKTVTISNSKVVSATI
jgi:hypothetical protein